MIEAAAPARVGILGNPSDGYGGRTLALAIPQLQATVWLEPADGVEILGGSDDQPTWPSVGAMAEHLDRLGYGTGVQLLAATVRTFVAVSQLVGSPVGPGFRLGYHTTIPRQVGLGGSSALVVAALRCLNAYHELEMPLEVLPSVALGVETTELGLAAGLQDRVVQTYGGLVAMDFSDLRFDARFGVSHGSYDLLDPAALPPLFVAYREAAAEPSYAFHQRLRARHDGGDPLVRETLRELASLVTEGRAALRWGDRDRMGTLMDRNMALRRSLGPLPEDQLELVDMAAAYGSHSTFAGSGGAVVGTYDDADHLELLCDAYAEIGADVAAIEPSPPGGPVAGSSDGAGRDDTAEPDGPDGLDEGDSDDADDPPPTNVLTLERHQR
jgi:glucuronokinase